MTIYRYRLNAVQGKQVHNMPEGAILLSTGIGDGDKAEGKLSVWAQVDNDRASEPRAFWCVPTGGALPDDPSANYLGTVIKLPYVLHVFAT